MVMTTSPWILVNVLRHLPGFTTLVVMALYALVALPMLLPQKVIVGEDGVLVRWAGRTRFISFGMIYEARLTPLGVVIDLDDERSIEVRLTHRADAQTARCTSLVERIQEGIEAHRRRGHAEDEALLARGSRSYEEWIRDMSAIGSAEGGYRAIAIPRERLWGVLENRAADASAREGAALALHAKLDDDERIRLNVVAQKSASPRLRIALDAVTNASPETMGAVLAEAEDEASEAADSRRAGLG
jgi:hypothetical protein